MVAYISGKINGDFNYKRKFDSAEEYLRSLGHVPLNPATMSLGLSYDAYIKIDLKMVEVSDAIFMLEDWRESKGAKIELMYATQLNKIIIFEEEMYWMSECPRCKVCIPLSKEEFENNEVICPVCGTILSKKVSEKDSIEFVKETIEKYL